VTEPEYFRDWRRYLRNALIEIDISSEQGDPLRLVEQAVRARENARREARRQRDDNLLYDEVWCVFDVDEHPRLDAARETARKHGILLAVSDPCFELWGLLHYQDQWSYIERSAVCDALRRYLPSYDKRLDCGTMRPAYPEARGRAIAIGERRARTEGASTNPSTDVWRLGDELIGSRGQPAV